VTRLNWLDFGKAVGILVVLLVHAGCSLGRITFYGGMFYMPVFFVAAGYTYRCKKEESFGGFVKKKAQRLLVPYFGTSAFLWLFFWVKDSVLSGNAGDLKLHSILGILYSRNQMYTAAYTGENPVLMDVLNAPLWFLTALFLVYIWYELASRSGKKALLLLIGLCVSAVWHYCTPLLLPWSLEAVPYFACFFGAGEWLRKYEEEKFLRDVRLQAALLLLFLCCSRSSVNLSIGNYGRSMLLYLIVGTAGSVLIFALGSWLERLCKPLVHVIGLVGQETLTILCWHMFLFMFLRTAAGMIGLSEGLAQAVLVVVSIVGLTAAGRVLHRFKI
jgi:fucose 4-O-acetylase-like acetyltransferase